LLESTKVKHSLGANSSSVSVNASCWNPFGPTAGGMYTISRCSDTPRWAL